MEERAKRKLTAILSADVKGYSRLMGEDDVATIRTLEEYRKVMSNLIDQHRGRVVDSPGDNLLAEFSSVVDAVESAVEIQTQLKTKNADLPENRRMEFRIGINLGDVVEEGNRIYGDGVNIAARIEGLADGGGISISRKAFQEVKNKLSLGYEYRGSHEVKNIQEPVRVYRVLTDRQYAGKLIGEKKQWSKLKLTFAVILSFVVIIGGVFGVLYAKYIYLPTPEDIDPDNKLAFDLPKGPSIAVLPFVNMSGDPEQEFLCDGITENIISALCSVRQLFVIARNSTFAYKGKQVNVQQIGQELGAGNIVEGSIQKSGDQLRIAVQLIDTKTGHHKWAEIYDRKLEGSFKLQDEITIEILKAIGISLAEGEKFRAKFGDINDLQILVKSMKAWRYFHRMNSEDNDLARRELLEIIESGYQNPTLYALLGTTYVMDLFFGTCESKIICFGKATEAAKKALSLDENCVKAHELAGYLFVLRGEHKKGIDEFKRAISINPSNADGYSGLGLALWTADRPLEGIDYIEKAILLNPNPPSFYYMQLGMNYRSAGEYEKSIVAHNKCLKIEPKNIFSHIALAATYALLGREKEARVSASEVLKINPDFSVENFIKSQPGKNREKNEQMAQNLWKAGLK